MSEEFREENARDLADELREKSNFDWDGLLDKLGEFDRADLEAPEESRMSAALEGIFDWALEPLRAERTAVPKRLELVGRRMLALCWVIEPGRFGDDPSATAVAASIGCHKAVFSELTAEVSRRFRVRNGHQMHGGNFKENKNT